MQTRGLMTITPSNQAAEKTKKSAAKIKAIIFDYDGVIVDSVAIGLKSHQEIAKHFGIPQFKSLEEFRKSQTTDYKVLWRSLGINTEDKFNAVRSIYKKIHKDGKPQLIPGVKELLKKLSSAYKLAVVSATYRDIIEKNLKEHSLESYFSHVITADDVEEIKPSPEGMLLCLQKLNIKPEEALFIGDMVIDIQMGRAAGVKTAIIPTYSWNTKADILKNNPDIVLESHNHIIKVLV